MVKTIEMYGKFMRETLLMAIEPFDAGMYEVAQYLEDNKEALNGLVVGSGRKYSI